MKRTAYGRRGSWSVTHLEATVDECFIKIQHKTLASSILCDEWQQQRSRVAVLVVAGRT